VAGRAGGARRARAFSGALRWLRPPRRLRPTRAGWSFFALTFGVGFAALNTGNNLLYLVLALMLAFLVLSGVLSESALRGVALRRRVPRELFAERDGWVSVEIANRQRRVVAYALVVEDRLVADDGGERAAGRCFALRIAPGESVQRSYRLRPERRGELAFAGFVVSTRFPFGLFSKSRAIEAPERALVYPAVDLVRSRATSVARASRARASPARAARVGGRRRARVRARRRAPPGSPGAPRCARARSGCARSRASTRARSEVRLRTAGAPPTSGFERDVRGSASEVSRAARTRAARRAAHRPRPARCRRRRAASALACSASSARVEPDRSSAMSRRGLPRRGDRSAPEIGVAARVRRHGDARDHRPARAVGARRHGRGVRALAVAADSSVRVADQPLDPERVDDGHHHGDHDRRTRRRALDGRPRPLRGTTQGLQLVDARPRKTEFLLVALALFQVVLAANLTDSVFFTPLLVAFVFAAVWTLVVHTLRSEALEAGQAREIPRAFTPGLARTAFAASGVAVLLAMLLFVLLPRLQASVVRGPMLGGALAASGFSDRVELGALGRIRSDSSVVMRVETIEGVPPDAGAAYWRGLAFDTFDGRAWSITPPRPPARARQRRGRRRARARPRPLRPGAADRARAGRGRRAVPDRRSARHPGNDPPARARRLRGPVRREPGGRAHSATRCARCAGNPTTTSCETTRPAAAPHRRPPARARSALARRSASSRRRSSRMRMATPSARARSSAT
jgi:hypothetical protein